MFNSEQPDVRIRTKRYLPVQLLGMDQLFDPADMQPVIMIDTVIT